MHSTARHKSVWWPQIYFTCSVHICVKMLSSFSNFLPSFKMPRSVIGFAIPLTECEQAWRCQFCMFNCFHRLSSVNGQLAKYYFPGKLASGTSSVPFSSTVCSENLASSFTNPSWSSPLSFSEKHNLVIATRHLQSLLNQEQIWSPQVTVDF